MTETAPAPVTGSYSDVRVVDLGPAVVEGIWTGQRPALLGLGVLVMLACATFVYSVSTPPSFGLGGRGKR